MCKKIENLQVRPCEQSELAAVMSLQEKIHRGMENTDWFALTSEEENKRFLEFPNVIIGVFDGDWLAAYGSVGFLGDAPENLGWDLELETEEAKRCALLDTIVVDSDYRGLGLQRELIRRCVSHAKNQQPGCQVLATVAPDNIYSLRNVQAEGFVILAKKEKYGGKERYILGV